MILFDRVPARRRRAATNPIAESGLDDVVTQVPAGAAGPMPEAHLVGSQREAVIAEPAAAQAAELDEAGMSTAEYAVGTIAACAFATAG